MKDHSHFKFSWKGSENKFPGLQKQKNRTRIYKPLRNACLTPQEGPISKMDKENLGKIWQMAHIVSQDINI